ncbi:MAG: pyridoxal-phosphate dependent enzyme, partial [Candidatus Margulisiibacteriota bacterium]
AGFLPEILNREIIDEIITVGHVDADRSVKALAQTEGILAGISSGAALWAALQVAKREQSKGKQIVVILPDTGERYISTWTFMEEST